MDMKKIEKIAIILIVLWVLTLASNPVITIIMGRLYSPQEFVNITFMQKGLLAARTILGLLVQIGIAVWLFMQAKRDKAARWVWALFGLTFGISAAILYFLLQLIEEMKLKRKSEKNG